MKLPAGKEDAVSPVIGVMLMIVVTVVIAAVVVIFSTGMAGDSTATTPMALFEADNQNVGPVSISGTTVNLLKSFDIVHKGGDEVIAENIQIVIESKKGSGDDTEFDFESGIQLVRKVNDVTILSGDSITTGERIRITLNPTATDHEKIFIGSLVKWTLSDTRTNGIIAKGEFVVPKA